MQARRRGEFVLCVRFVDHFRSCCTQPVRARIHGSLNLPCPPPLLLPCKLRPTYSRGERSIVAPRGKVGWRKDRRTHFLRNLRTELYSGWVRVRGKGAITQLRENKEKNLSPITRAIHFSSTLFSLIPRIFFPLSSCIYVFSPIWDLHRNS